MNIALLLAGGKSSRLWPLSKNTPKYLIDILGKPLIIHLIEGLKSSLKIEKFYISLNICHKKYEKLLLNNNHNVELIYEDNYLGTGGAIKFFIDNHFPSISNGLFISNCDIIYDLDFKSFNEDIDSNSYDGYIGGISNDNYRRFGAIDIDSTYRIINFYEKTNDESTLTYIKDKALPVNTGIYYFSNKLVSYFKNRKISYPSSLETELFPTLIKEFKLKCTLPYIKYWFDIGTIEGFTECCRYLYKNNISINSDYKFYNLFDSISHRSSYINNPSFSLKNTILMKNISIGNNSKIINSIICDSVTIGNDVIIEDSIIGDSISIANGSILKLSKIGS